MKICISTVYDANNCGAFLQAYALKKILENMGHEVYHIKFRTNRERKHSYFNYGNISKIKYMKRHLGFTGKNYKIYKNAVSEFTEIYPIDTKNMDLLIIGSDELWNVTNENVLKTIKISSYTCKRKAAFSVSCGNSTAGDIVKYKRLTDSIKDLQYIFVRDVYTKTAVESITDKETGLVCDPTLLLSREQYPKKKYKKMKDRYLLYYGYWSDENTRKNIRKYAEKNDLKVLAVGIDNYWCDMSIPCHPLDFIKYIEDAEAVVTATFHGTIFSFLCEKNVVCLDYGSNKLKDLAKRLDVENRIIYDNCGYDQFEKLLKQRIDYGTVNQNIEKMREESLQSLEKIINQSEIGDTMESLVSIVVPVYKNNYLDRCIKSLVEQTYRKIQIILVDDGSTDGSLDICKKWKEKDERIVVIEKKNGGVASARNEGIRYALKNNKNGYITFIDDDDYMHKEGISELYQLIKKYHTEIAWADFYVVNARTGEIENNHINEFEQILDSKEILMKEQWRTSYSLVWGKLFKTSLWENVRLPDWCRAYDDGATTFKLLYAAKKVAMTKKKVLYYYLSKEGITRNKVQEDRCREALYTQTEKIAFYEKNKEKDLLRMAYVGYANDILDCMVYSASFENGENFYREMKRLYRHIVLKTILSKTSFRNKLRYIVYAINPQMVITRNK